MSIKQAMSIQEKVRQSRLEAAGLKERILRCPHCGFRMETLYEDARGHFRSKCQKCKTETVFNLAYFRTAGTRSEYRYRTNKRYVR